MNTVRCDISVLFNDAGRVYAVVDKKKYSSSTDPSATE